MARYSVHIWQLPPRTSRFEIPVPCWPSEGRNNARVEESAVTSLATALNWRRRHKEVLVGSRTPCWQARGMGLDIRDACQSKLKQPGRHARCGTWCVGTSSVLGLIFLHCFVSTVPLWLRSFRLRIFMSMQHQPSKSNRCSTRHPSVMDCV